MTDPADTPTSAGDVLNSPPAPPPFYDGFANAETKDWAGKSGFKSAEDLAAHARKFDAFKDSDPANLVALPKADAKAEEHVALLRRLGAPEDGAAYGLDKLEGADKELAGAAQGWFTEAGLLPWQAQIIAGAQMAFVKAQTEKMVAEDKASGARELAQLKTEWASDYDANVELSRRALRTAAREAGLSEDDAKGFVSFIEQGAGTRVALKMAAFFGRFLKEGEFVDGKGGKQEPNDMAKRWYPNSGG